MAGAGVQQHDREVGSARVKEWYERPSNEMKPNFKIWLARHRDIDRVLDSRLLLPYELEIPSGSYPTHDGQTY